MSKKINQIVVFYGDHSRHVCPVLRVFAPARAVGIDVREGSERTNDQLLSYPGFIDEADLVIIQRDFPADVEAYETVVGRAKQAGKRVIYDIDDLLINLPRDHPDVERYDPSRLTTLRAIIESDAVTVASPALQ